jgi:hypothetical protein
VLMLPWLRTEAISLLEFTLAVCAIRLMDSKGRLTRFKNLRLYEQLWISDHLDTEGAISLSEESRFS